MYCSAYSSLWIDIMRNLKRLGNQISTSIPVDENGYLGRECPDCEQYFKITPGTGLTGTDLQCHCPYCGHVAAPNHFFTKAQIEYAKSIAINKFTGAMLKDMKALEFNHPPKGMFGIGFSMKVDGRPHPIYRYTEKDLEEEVVCDNCTLRYTVFGTFAFCPDCGRHNSLQILEKNLALAKKQIDLAAQVDSDLASHLIADALENGVSSFDGFGRETCRVHSSKALEAKEASSISFQNLDGAQKKIQRQFSIDLNDALDSAEWRFACCCFQKRHLLAHKMGIVDDAYMKATSDPQAKVGRKVGIPAEEVLVLLISIRSLGLYLTSELEKKEG